MHLWYKKESKQIASVNIYYENFISLNGVLGTSIKGMQDRYMNGEKSFKHHVKNESCMYRKKIMEPRSNKQKIECPQDWEKLNSSITLNSTQRLELRNLLGEKQKIFLSNFTDMDRENLNHILDFYISIVRCVDTSQCDAQKAIDTFQYSMINFINMYCTLYEISSNEWNSEISRDEIIIHFIMNGNISVAHLKKQDTKRENIFRCNNHRKIENEYY